MSNPFPIEPYRGMKEELKDLLTRTEMLNRESEGGFAGDLATLRDAVASLEDLTPPDVRTVPALIAMRERAELMGRTLGIEVPLPSVMALTELLSTLDSIIARGASGEGEAEGENGSDGAVALGQPREAEGQEEGSST